MTAWQRTSQTLSLAAAGIGALGLAGWVFGIDAFKRVYPAWVTMKANTAVCLILTGTAVALLRDEEASSRRRRLAQIFAAIIGAVGLLTLGEHLLGRDFGIDQVFFHESQAAAGRSFPGRMGPTSALIFILLGAAIAFYDYRTKRGGWPAQFCVSGAGALTAVIFLSYFYNVEIPGWLMPYVSIALHTVIAFSLLGLALLLARPDRGFAAIFLADNAGGEVARRLLPTALLMPGLLGWLFVLARQANYLTKGSAIGLLAASVTVIFVVLVWWIARALAETDAQRLAVQENLQRMDSARAQLAAIVDSSDDAIISKTLEGIVTSWNAGAERLFGYSAAEMIGQPLLRIIPPDRQNEEVDILRRLRAGERIDHFETVRVTRDGQLVDISVSISPMRDAAGAIIGASKIARAITQRKLFEAELRAARDTAEAASRAKDEFLAALSHELRTPLTPVLMLATDMEHSAEVSAGVRRDFAMIRKNVELEARIIDDLLDLTRITHGKLALRFETVDVHALIEHAVSILHIDSEAKKIATAFELEASAHHVSGDAVRLEQIFWNVLKNAIKFTPSGGQITIRSWNEAGLLRVALTDTGLGITADEMPRIFTAFTQGREAAAARFGGLGLGLSISALLAREHHGRIWAESAGRDHGSTFHLELPLAAAPTSDLSAPSSHAPKSAPALRILLVEDHEDTRSILQRLLTRWGHQVTAVASIAQARAAMLNGISFDLLLSDIGLLDGTGFEVIAAFREKSNAPAIALSGYGMEADIARAQAAGFSAQLIKPISTEHLRELLTHLTSP